MKCAADDMDCVDTVFRSLPTEINKPPSEKIRVLIDEATMVACKADLGQIKNILGGAWNDEYLC